MRPTTALAIVGFDADDTLWQNEKFFQLSEENFAELLSEFSTRKNVRDCFLATERKNLGHYGFGVKGFTLSMIESAIDITDGRVPVAVISELLNLGREMLKHPIELLPGARETIEVVSQTAKVVLITKGDLLDQERKLAQSGLGDLFDGIEIVSDKTAENYARIFRKYRVQTDSAMMVGNSIRSDILPVLEVGGWGVYVPHGLEWDFEKDDPPSQHPRFRQLKKISQVIDLVRDLQSSGSLEVAYDG